MLAPLANPRVPCVPAAFSVKPEKTHGPATSIASFAPTVSKPLILPANPCGAVRSSVPPLPVNETVWPAATVESNSSVEAPEISSDPVPVTAPCTSSVAAVTSIVPVLVTAGAIALVARPAGLLEQAGVVDIRGRRSAEPDPAVVENVVGRLRSVEEDRLVGGDIIAQRHLSAALVDGIGVFPLDGPADRQPGDCRRSLGIEEFEPSTVPPENASLAPVSTSAPPVSASVSPAASLKAPA